MKQEIETIAMWDYSNVIEQRTNEQYIHRPVRLLGAIIQYKSSEEWKESRRTVNHKRNDK
jgi:hypothetical protein